VWIVDDGMETGREDRGVCLLSLACVGEDE